MLVVDDMPEVREVLTAMLEAELDLKVVAAPSAEDALKVLDAGPVAALLTDYKMPGADGLELAAEVRRRYPDLPIALMTSSRSAGVQEAAEASDAVDLFLRKPFGIEEWVEAVRRLLDRHP